MTEIKNNPIIDAILPKCIIDNAKFSYVMRVDGQRILFQDSSSADYFAKHYDELGYKVIRTESWKEEETV